MRTRLEQQLASVKVTKPFVFSCNVATNNVNAVRTTLLDLARAHCFVVVLLQFVDRLPLPQLARLFVGTEHSCLRFFVAGHADVILDLGVTDVAPFGWFNKRSNAHYFSTDNTFF